MTWSSWCGDSISSLIGAIQTNMCSSRGRIVTVGAVRGRLYNTPLASEKQQQQWVVKKVSVKRSGWLGTEYIITCAIGSVGGKPIVKGQVPVFGIVVVDDKKGVPLFVDYKNGLKVTPVFGGDSVEVKLSVPGSSWSSGVGGGVDEDGGSSAGGVSGMRVILMVDMYPIFNAVVGVDAE
ncbi:hypothetical protein BDR26DRAFT_128553 [Obelidium mucronatum]|nr:hypothetical protein BDR26DRAFT_128553 [Obelidium mucronatum]